MAINKTSDAVVMSREALQYLAGLINEIVSAPDVLIDDNNLATNQTMSSVRIDSLITKCLQDANSHAESITNALTKLTAEKTTVQPTLNNSKLNVIYLYSNDGNAPFEQYLQISDTELIDIGSTSITLGDYLTKLDASKTYCKQVDFNSLNTTVTNLKTEIVDEINNACPEITIVCLGCPKQEKWIEKNKDKINTKIIFGNGGAIDFWSGNIKRAPVFFINHKIEWLFRLFQDFNWKRIKRQLKIFQFLWEMKNHRYKIEKI